MRTSLLMLTFVSALAAGEAAVPNVVPNAAPAAVPNPAVVPPANAPAADIPWQKIELKHIALPAPRAVLSPGYFDSELQSFVVFDKKNECDDTKLPPAKGHPGAVKAKKMQKFIWIDFNGDGKPSGEETKAIDADGWTEPFQYEAAYDGGISGTLMFRLHSVIEDEKYAIIRCCARVGEIEGQKIVLLDDSGNGRFNDIGRDAVIVADNPVALLGKHILIGENFYEVLVQEAGFTLEYRPAKLDYGWVDLLEKFKPPQKSEGLRIHTLIIDGPMGSFSMNMQRRNVKVPVGAYDIVFGLFERAKETVYMKKGEKTSFSVTAGKVASPVFGGDVNAKFDVTYDGKEVTIGAPTFFGEAGEKYYPENFKTQPLTGSIAQVYEDSMKLEHRTVFGTHRFDLLPNGQPEPLKFKPFRSHADDYEATITYNSGILGSVLTHQGYQYVPKKTPAKKPD